MNVKADQVVEAIAGFVKRSLDPMRGQVRGLVERADKHFQRIEALEARVAALERKQVKTPSVQLIKAGHR